MTRVAPPNMPEAPKSPDAQNIPVPQISSTRFARVSWIWLVPLITALIGVSLFIRSVANNGPTVTVRFDTAEGLVPGVTKVKYKEVEVGEVTSVRLSEDLSQILAEIELDKAAQKFAVEGTRFWVVRPRVAASGISGLNTLLSGAYIGVEAGHSKIMRKRFIGLEIPPIVAGDLKGHQFILHSKTLGSLDVGSAVFYRRIRVGQVVRYELDKEGEGVAVHIFVKAPYDQYVNPATRFWHASGMEFQFDSAGLKFNIQSLASLVAGGIAFQTVQKDGVQKAMPPAANGASFVLAANSSEALQEGGGPEVLATLYFDKSLKGLNVGAPVDFRGLVLGRVTSMDIDFDAKKHAFQMVVGVTLQAERLSQLAHIMSQTTPLSMPCETGGQALASLVEHGLRAQLQIGNMLINSLYIALDFLPNTTRAYHAPTPTLEIPTLPGEINSMQQTVSSILGSLKKVPFEQIGQALKNTLTKADSVLTHIDTELAPQASRTLETLQQTLEQAQANLEVDSPLQTEVHHTLTEFTRAMQSLNTLADYLARHPDALLRGQSKDERSDEK